MIKQQTYQLKIVLMGIRPPIWRRIQIPSSYTFWDLHVAIQDAMGWEDYHLHQFEFSDPRKQAKAVIGLPDNELSPAFRREILIDWQEYIVNWFTLQNPKAKYWYDFGDDWWHEILLEKIAPAEKEIPYPRCIAGKRACPPEDSGGPWGYMEKLEIIKEPKHEWYVETRDWLGANFDPERFIPDAIIFNNPKKRLRDVISHMGTG